MTAVYFALTSITLPPLNTIMLYSDSQAVVGVLKKGGSSTAYKEYGTVFARQSHNNTQKTTLFHYSFEADNCKKFPVIPGISKLCINNMSSFEMFNKRLVLVSKKNHQRLIVKDLKLTREISNARNHFRTP